MDIESRRASYEEELMAKIAWYYYIDNLTQQQIADQLGIPRLRVIKLLEKARQFGIVQFKISESNAHTEMENIIARHFGLKDVFIVPAAAGLKNRNEALAQAAAIYISNRIPDNAYINIGYGDTTCRILNHLANNSSTRISVVSLTGGVNYYLPNTFSSVFNARLFLTPAPFVMSNKEMVEAICNEPAVREIAEMVPLSTMTIVGIGGIDDNATVVSSGIMSPKDLRYLAMQGAVGDVLCHFLDINGKPVESPIDDRLISTPLGVLAAQNNVIGVAGGENKVNAIIGALNGNFLDILITDRDTAELIIKRSV
ncbi:MAG: sugar-binding transcriptional regulator [Flexilinea sp.]|nr:sugar-binding transcriptional regulator [Flexilinea sp.]